MERVGIVVQRLPFDEFHDEIGRPSSVVPPSADGRCADGRVRPGLALGAKAPENKICVHAALNELYRDSILNSRSARIAS